MSSGQLAGRIALVTGGSRGIGRGIALALAREGADVAINYRREAEEAEKVVAEIKDDVALKNLKEGVKDSGGKEIKKPFTGKLSEADMKALIEYCKSFAKK